MPVTISSATAKLTISIKRRLGNGDEVFIAPGVEVHCTEAELDAKQAEVTERVNGWMEQLLATYPDPTDELEEDEEADEEADEEEAEDEEEEAEDEDEFTEDDIAKMAKKDLVALIKEHELEVDTKLAIKELRAAVIEALFEEEGEEEDEDEESDEEEGEAYDEAELKAMKLEELQGIVESWGIDHPKLAKGIAVGAKKTAYIKHILAQQE